MTRSLSDSTCGDRSAILEDETGKTHPEKAERALPKLLMQTAAGVMLIFIISLFTAQREAIDTKLTTSDLDVASESIIRDAGWENFSIAYNPHSQGNQPHLSHVIVGEGMVVKGALVFDLELLEGTLRARAADKISFGSTQEQDTTARLVARSINSAGLQFPFDPPLPDKGYTPQIVDHKIVLQEHFWRAWWRQFTREKAQSA